MQPEFWYSRWQNNQIGFHQRAVNPYLQRFWPGLEVPVGARVLVPLCGKSLDLAWLAAQGYGVLGVELSQTAIEGFFEEQGLTLSLSSRGPSSVIAPMAWSCGVGMSSHSARWTSPIALGCTTARH